jgi:hypothetical protein
VRRGRLPDPADAAVRSDRLTSYPGSRTSSSSQSAPSTRASTGGCLPATIAEAAARAAALNSARRSRLERRAFPGRSGARRGDANYREVPAESERLRFARPGYDEAYAQTLWRLRLTPCNRKEGPSGAGP